MRERLDALQQALMQIYEEAPTDLASQIRYYQLLRKQCVLEYYLRKEGYITIGLHHLPVTRVSEYHAKQAIKMVLLLKSLQMSPYGNERWSLQDTSADLLDSPPKNCFKKEGFDVEVWFDKDPKNVYPYTNWKWIYYQDESDQWHKVPGETDYNGLYFEEVNGDRTYFLLFHKDAARFGNTNEWIVNVGNEQISLSTNSSSRRSTSGPSQQPSTVGEQSPGPSRDTYTTEETDQRRVTQESPQSTGERLPLRRRRKRGEGKQTPKKRRRGGGGADRHTSSPTASEVGGSHRSVVRSGLSRLERLQAEARDPLVIILRGPPNTLKCWRYRCNSKLNACFEYMSTVFRWVTNNANLQGSRVLITFKSQSQRDQFIKLAHFPSGTTYSFGNLDQL